MTEKPQYLAQIEELERLTIVRLKGNIDQDMIPVIEDRIQFNRKAGSKVDNNVLVDYRLVDKIDSAAVAFHLVRLKEYEAKGYKIGFINPSEELKVFLQMYHLTNAFKIYTSEQEALDELNS